MKRKGLERNNKEEKQPRKEKETKEEMGISVFKRSVPNKERNNSKHKIHFWS